MLHSLPSNSKTQKSSTLNTLFILLGTGFASVTLLVLGYFSGNAFSLLVVHYIDKYLVSAALNTLQTTVLSPIFYLAVTIILILERLFPAKPQKLFSIGLLQDSVWLLMEGIFQVTAVALTAKVMISFYNGYLDFLTIDFIRTLPFYVRFIIGVLFVDFLGWFTHWVRHRVGVLWQFHAVHHSQRELNMFTDLRYHFIEYMIVQVIITIPLLAFIQDRPTIVGFMLFHVWFTHLYHGNIRSNYGILRYIFITPQSHRIHHSIELRHRDKNFGVLFSIWDYLFQTQYKKYDEYPDTGIDDEDFPHESSMRFFNLLLTPLLQTIYPFQAIARNMKKKRSKK